MPACPVDVSDFGAPCATYTAMCSCAEWLYVCLQPAAQEIVDAYADIMTEQYTSRMARKLGLKEYRWVCQKCAQ